MSAGTTVEQSAATSPTPATRVGTWDEQAQGATTWPVAFGASYGGDASVIGGGSTGLPGALQRGGFWDSGANAGVFDIEAGHAPSDMGNNTGFRCAR